MTIYRYTVQPIVAGIGRFGRELDNGIATMLLGRLRG